MDRGRRHGLGDVQAEKVVNGTKSVGTFVKKITKRSHVQGRAGQGRGGET